MIRCGIGMNILQSIKAFPYREIDASQHNGSIILFLRCLSKSYRGMGSLQNPNSLYKVNRITFACDLTEAVITTFTKKACLYSPT